MVVHERRAKRRILLSYKLVVVNVRLCVANNVRGEDGYPAAVVTNRSLISPPVSGNGGRFSHDSVSSYNNRFEKCTAFPTSPAAYPYNPPKISLKLNKKVTKTQKTYILHFVIKNLKTFLFDSYLVLIEKQKY